MAVGQWEEVYLRAYDTVSEARTSIGSYLSFYNSGRLIRASTANAGSGLFNRPLLRSGVIDRGTMVARHAGRRSQRLWT